jgi:hypothetical protein
MITLVGTLPKADEAYVAYDSKYISEGRNQLGSGGIYWLGGIHDLNHNMALNIGYGVASRSNVNYDEFYLGVTYSNTYEGLDYSIGYTRFEFFQDKISDDEFTLTLSYTELDWFTAIANALYSAESGGYFLELGGQKDIRLNDNLAITPHILFAHDYGYASAGVKGRNHTSVGTTLNYAISNELTISAIFEQTFGHSTIKKEGNGANQLWAGLRFIYHW